MMVIAICFLDIVLIVLTLTMEQSTVVQVGFESPVYSVSEGDGEVTVSVTWFGNGVELGRPVTVRVSNSGGNATGECRYWILMHYPSNTILLCNFSLYSHTK